MRTTSLIVALLLVSASAFADPVDDLDAAEARSRKMTISRQLGVGFILGEPTALSAKFMLAAHSGVQLHVGYGIGNRGRFVLIGDYLFHARDLIPPIRNTGIITPYVGVGGRLGIHTGDPFLGIRFPLGLSFWLSAVPIEVFIEVAIGIGLLPSTVALIDGGLGGRFYF